MTELEREPNPGECPCQERNLGNRACGTRRVVSWLSVFVGFVIGCTVGMLACSQNGWMTALRWCVG